MSTLQLLKLTTNHSKSNRTEQINESGRSVSVKGSDRAKDYQTNQEGSGPSQPLGEAKAMSRLNRTLSKDHFKAVKSGSKPKVVTCRLTDNSFKIAARVRTEADNENCHSPLPKKDTKQPRLNTQGSASTFHKSNALNSSINTEARSAKPVIKYNLQSRDQLSCSSNQSQFVGQAITQIHGRQEGMIKEQKALERHVAEMKIKVEEERNMMNLSRNTHKNVASEISKSQNRTKNMLSQLPRLVKNVEQLTKETKLLEATAKQRERDTQKMDSQISSQRELVVMFESIIEELRGQVRLEKQQKSQLVKRTASIRNKEKSLRERSSMQQKSTHKILNRVMASIGRWE